MILMHRALVLRSTVILGVGGMLFNCSSSSSLPPDHDGGGVVALEGGAHIPDTGSSVDAAACFPDNDGINGGDYTFVITVDDTRFSKTIINTQNDAKATVKLTNNGTKPHGFKVGCVSDLSSYPNLPAGCPTTVCFPSNAEIAPLAPGASATIVIDTPTPDGLIYPFTSNDPDDKDVAALNDGQWTLM
jgi:hypothetical protein